MNAVQRPIVASYVANNTEVLGYILTLFFKQPSKIADVTWGKGSFWRQQVEQKKVDVVHVHTINGEAPCVTPGRHTVYASDLSTGTDCRALPYRDDMLDGLVLDPPYAGTGGTGINQKDDGTQTKASGYGTIQGYGNQVLGSRSTDKILELYYEGIQEAWRVLRWDGLILVKCMDQVESGQLRLLHVDLVNHLRDHGWTIEQVFYVTALKDPLMRHPYQHHARQNISMWLVARKSRKQLRKSAR